jgi:hypothetical protein
MNQTPLDELPKPPPLSHRMTSGEMSNAIMAQMSYAHRKLILKKQAESQQKAARSAPPATN